MKCKRCMLMKHLVNCIKSHQDSRRYLGLASCQQSFPHQTLLLRSPSVHQAASDSSLHSLPPCSDLTLSQERPNGVSLHPPARQQKLFQRVWSYTREKTLIYLYPFAQPSLVFHLPTKAIWYALCISAMYKVSKLVTDATYRFHPILKMCLCK